MSELFGPSQSRGLVSFFSKKNLMITRKKYSDILPVGRSRYTHTGLAQAVFPSACTSFR